MIKKLIMGLILPVAITIVFVLLRISLPLKTILAISLTIFFALLITYPWVWKPRKFTLGRLTLFALVVSSVSAAVLGIANWFSK
jgi:hypothetical protein